MGKLVKRLIISSLAVFVALAVFGSVPGVKLGNLGLATAEAGYRNYDRNRDHDYKRYDRYDRYHKDYGRKKYDHRYRDYHKKHLKKRGYGHDRDYRSSRNFSSFDYRNDVDIDTDIDIDANTGRNDISRNTIVGDVETGDIDVDVRL